jgi:AcrR family transcriptional regulator
LKPTRRERLREATYEEIKSTAWKQIAKSGAPALSLRAIARDMGVTPPALYRYYKDRNALVTTLVEDAFDDFANAMEAARNACKPDDHVGKFRAIGFAYRAWAVKHPQRFALIFGTPIPGYQISGNPGTAAQRSFLILVGVIGDAYQADRFNLSSEYEALTPSLQARFEVFRKMGLPYPPIVMQLALASWSWIHGLTALEVLGELPSFLEENIEDFIRFEMEAFINRLRLE